MRHATLISRLLAGLFALALLSFVTPGAQAQGDVRKGLYISKAAGCVGCHTSEAKGAPAYAGGRALKTPFGTFYGPNITSHPTAGIGKWTLDDFRRAIRLGERPDGAHYFPAFPYPSFTGMSEADIADLWAYLRSVPPSETPSRAHDLRFPFGFRAPVALWKWLFFTPGPTAAAPGTSAAASRGAYLVGALGHCAECHTPRNMLGALKSARRLGGAEIEGKYAPNLTPARLKKWSDAELREVLTTGMTPDGDVLAAAMGEVVTNTLSQLTPEDLAAMIAYLRALPEVPEEKR
jgi:mono/diheme cytochrome c family protein